MASLTAKILCSAHNNALSVVDETACAVFSAYRELARNGRLGFRQHAPQHYQFDGHRLERWFLKTLINMAIGGGVSLGEPIGSDSIRGGCPSKRLVDIAFGKRCFFNGAGLYSVGYVGQNIRSDESLHATVLVHENIIKGALFRFRGFGFLLFVDEGGLPPSVSRLHLGGMDWSLFDFFYRQRRMQVVRNSVVLESIEYTW